MPATITTDQVWREVENQLFAVLGTVSAAGEARTVGIVYVVRERRLYIGSGRESWKVRHIQKNPYVSLTVTIPKRVPFLPWIKIPAATVTFKGIGTIHEVNDLDAEIKQALLRGMEVDEEFISKQRFIQVEPKGEFITYGVGVSLLTMRKPEESRGRVSVS